MPPIGWFVDLTEAETYFTNERLETDAWDSLTNAQKTKGLWHGYNRLYYSPEFSLPLYADATAAQLVILKKAQGEMAYYLAGHIWGGDEDRRKGIQAQGVIKAGVVQEEYLKDMLLQTPIPGPVRDLLDAFSTDNSRIFIADLERSENLPASEAPPRIFDYSLFDLLDGEDY